MVQIISYIVASICYGALTAFTCAAFFRLRRLQKDIDELKHLQMENLMLAKFEHLRNKINDLNQMKKTLTNLVEREEFDEAARMKAIITATEEDAMKLLKNFQDDYGSDVIELSKINEQ